MPTSPRGFFALVVLVLVCATTSCGGDAPAAARWAGTVDSLAGGGLHVSNPAEGVWSPDEAWRLVEDLRIGTLEGEGPDLFGQVRDVAVDGLGRIWVVEAQAAEVRVFGPDGAHVRTVARRGGGPGELQQPSQLLFGPDGNAWIGDMGNRRYEVFDTAGGRVAGHPMQGMSFGFGARFDAEGHLVDRDNFQTDGGFDAVYIRRRADEGLPAIDTFPVPDMGEGRTSEQRFTMDGRTMMIQMPVPFVHQPAATLHEGGWFWARRGGEEGYRFMKLGLAGDTLLMVDREHTPVRVTAQERDSALSREGPFGSDLTFDESEIPEVHPAFQGIADLPDGHVLVDRVVAEGGLRAWDVFDPEGRYLGRLDRPEGMQSFRPMTYRNDALYGVARGEFDEQYVVRLRIERGPGGD